MGDDVRRDDDTGPHMPEGPDGRGERGGPRGGGRFGGRMGGFARSRRCEFCAEKTGVDFKDSSRLRRYLSDAGKILGRRQTGACARHQRRLSVALKRARYLALLPYVAEKNR